MDDSSPPPLPTTPPGRPRRLGCFVKGCLLTITVLMFIGVGIGAFGWFVVKSGQAYFTEQQVPTRVFDATDEQYQAVLAKLEPFNQAINEGHAATLELTADDFNTLIARLPQLASLRGQTFVNVVDGQLVADLSFPFNEGTGPGQYFVNARVTLDASFAGGKFTFALRHAAPLQGEAREGLLPTLLREPWFLQNYSEMINRDANGFARDQTRKDPGIANVLAKVRTAVIQGDKIVVTSVERPDVSPVVIPAKTE